MSTFWKIIQSLVLVIARLAFAGVVLAHAWKHWFRQSMDGFVTQLSDAGVIEPEIFAWGTLILEVVGGVFLVLGLATRIVALAFVAEATLSILWIHWANGIFATDNGIELALLQGIVALVFVAWGGGAIAFDRFFGRGRKKDSDAVDTSYSSGYSY
ncbi:MAG: DoxX family protein [Propionibacteriaceae bacterium]|jgi:putative oxidoreductase|nr:DoxX family protein [Propionibacteriaceae bacterium]